MSTAWLPDSLPFDPAIPAESLRQLPTRRAAVFALYGEDERAEPYVGATPDLRRRLERLLKPAAGQTRRLQLVSRIRRIAWRLTGSEFESLLVQFAVLHQVYGARALERMHLRNPAFVRFHGSNPFPRLTITTRPSQREPQWAYGPYPSRAAAERATDELLKLFLLRRCEENLAPDPAHPGCVYGEMKKCLAPCQQACTNARYAEEASRVEAFLASRGESQAATLRHAREKASENLEFEQAAEAHTALQKVEAVQSLMPELARPTSQLTLCFLQASANPDEVAVFLYQAAQLRGPAGFSTLGMRIQNEQSGSSSLFAQPIAVQAIPEATPDGTPRTEAPRASRDILEARLDAALQQLAAQPAEPDPLTRQAHIALVTRWYYRPQVRRVGEVFFPDADGHWPVKAILRGIGRVAAAGITARGAHLAALPATDPESPATPADPVAPPPPASE